MWSALRSIWIVFKHLFMRHVTVQYPETKRRLPPRWRGRIVLTRDARGEERCVACNLCAVACPPSCISLQAATRPDGRRYPPFSASISRAASSAASARRLARLTPSSSRQTTR